MAGTYDCLTPHRVYAPGACLWLDVRCRRCKRCMELRRWSWTCRAAREQVASINTFFVTLTYRPDCRAEILRAVSADRSGSSQPQRLSKAAGRYVGLYLKRLRASGHGIRYLMVPEPHANGFPHYHGLIHDVVGSTHVDDLVGEWEYGFSVVKHVRDARAIKYVCKYLSKERFARVRASRAYGSDSLTHCQTGMPVVAV